MVHVLARITALPASADTMREILVELAAQTRKEAGCLHYALFQQDGAAHIFQTVERWADDAAVDRAVASAGPSTSFTRSRPSASPLRACERMTPELPRAPYNAPRATTRATSPAVVPSGSELAAATASRKVAAMLDPVSPSGTG